MPPTKTNLIARAREAASESMIYEDRPLNPHELFGELADELEAVVRQRDELLRLLAEVLDEVDNYPYSNGGRSLLGSDFENRIRTVIAACKES